MTDFVFPPIPQASVAVRGSRQRYAVGRIFCVGRNYAAHAREMGGNPDREPPFFFNKAPAHLLASGATVPYPPGTRDYHHEMELVVAIGQPAFRIAPEQGQACVWGYACGLDMTRRDLQGEAKKAGRPWSFGKDFEHAAVIGELVPASQTGALARGRIELAVNGQTRQQGDLADLIWSVPEVVANLSQYYHLQPGDLIYTGTPEGVGAVQPGDVLAGRIEGVGEIQLTIGQPE
ncbi:MAG: fumarylacetoacetate hydrolase family protein [Burkholderiaceae bacterium]|jgi:fumarylpyruvate hydrolase|nr:fumarylacetoacetate hydrolase family protein [Pseudomonadota bacterium]MBS0597957.1 fumarylacetoacetate hydrolase family protein [Pseudomonadota bacterium]MCO5114919.1 fumarylacetoacetate hydrolase family protein [Burkholderiaceae bacterium]MCP5217659.1 fumarylacetoacetate hydrolase family protein [Burkholderiaceae bacterium]